MTAMTMRPAAITDTDVYTNQGAEDWIIDDSIEACFSQPQLWWHVRDNRWEDDWETMLRARVYSYLITKLPAEMWKDGAENDVR